MRKIPEDLQSKGRVYPRVGSLLRVLDNIKNNSSLFKQYLSVRYSSGRSRSRRLKDNDNLTVYQNEENRVNRDFDNDRHFPLETVTLQSHKLEHNTELNKATIHIGASADEYARSFNALALTIGYDIFFRNGAYKPETEEGRKIIAHELTHIAQYEEGRTTAKETVKELENEAEMEETREGYDDDPVQEVEIGGEIFHLRPSEHKEVIHDAVVMTKHWFEEQRHIVGEKEYLRLLAKYAAWKKRN